MVTFDCQTDFVEEIQEKNVTLPQLPGHNNFLGHAKIVECVADCRLRWKQLPNSPK